MKNRCCQLIVFLISVTSATSRLLADTAETQNLEKLVDKWVQEVLHTMEADKEHSLKPHDGRSKPASKTVNKQVSNLDFTNNNTPNLNFNKYTGRSKLDELSEKSYERADIRDLICKLVGRKGELCTRSEDDNRLIIPLDFDNYLDNTQKKNPDKILAEIEKAMQMSTHEGDINKYREFNNVKKSLEEEQRDRRENTLLKYNLRQDMEKCSKYSKCRAALRQEMKKCSKYGRCKRVERTNAFDEIDGLEDKNAPTVNRDVIKYVSYDTNADIEIDISEMYNDLKLLNDDKYYDDANPVKLYFRMSIGSTAVSGKIILKNPFLPQTLRQKFKKKMGTPLKMGLPILPGLTNRGRGGNVNPLNQ